VDYDTVPPLVNKFAIRHTALHDFAGAYCIEGRLLHFIGQWKIPFLKITIEADCSIV
jgi:hypothetical protein